MAKSKLTKEERQALTAVMTALGVWLAEVFALAQQTPTGREDSSRVEKASKTLVDELDEAGKV